MQLFIAKILKAEYMTITVSCLVSKYNLKGLCRVCLILYNNVFSTAYSYCCSVIRSGSLDNQAARTMIRSAVNWTVHSVSNYNNDFNYRNHHIKSTTLDCLQAVSLYELFV